MAPSKGRHDGLPIIPVQGLDEAFVNTFNTLKIMDPRTWTFDVDRYLNPFVPCPPWRRLPYPVARFLGHRKPDFKPWPLENIVTIFWAFIGAFCGISVIGVVVLHIPEFQHRSVPLLISSFGAAAVLEFYAIESPLAQPRNAIVGHMLSAVIGVGISKLFQLSPHFESLQWLGAALSCATVIAVMGLTKTVHPPAGATALMAVAEPSVVQLGWFLLPVVLLGISLMMTVALLVNNLARRFPLYWWTNEDLGLRKHPSESQSDGELTYHNRAKHTEMWMNDTSVSGHEGTTTSTMHTKIHDSGEDDEDRDIERGMHNFQHVNSSSTSVILRQGGLSLPDHFSVSPEERRMLECICRRL